MIKWLIAGLVAFVPITFPCWAQTRIKDIASLENTAGQPLIGSGMVMGLPGTGDNGGNTAQVMVTAKVAMGAVAGTRLEAMVLAVSNARSLRGGSLAPTPLRNGAGQIWAIADGPIASTGLVAQSATQMVFQGNAASGTILDGAVLQQDMPPVLDPSTQQIRLMLRNPDFTTAKRVADAINGAMGQKVARMRDNTVIIVTLPSPLPDGTADLMAFIEDIPVTPDRAVNRVVIDSRSGTIISGADIAVAPTAISHGELTIRISERPRAQRSNIEISDSSGQIINSAADGTVESLLTALKASGLTTFDQIAVLQSLHAAGAISAEVISR